MSNIAKRQEKEKQTVIDALRKTPIIQIVCDKTGVSRATFYRWKSEDKSFAKKAEDALHDGTTLVNDLAESQLIGTIREKNLGAITFWLKHHHPAYENKLEITGRLKHDYELTTEQEKLISKALSMLTKPKGKNI